MKSKSVLITGASGFIGKNVASLFKSKGWLVYGIGHNQIEDKNIDFYYSGPVNLENLQHFCLTPDIVIHCAGGATVSQAIDEPWLDFSKTVCSTSDVLEFIRLYCPNAKLLYISSAAVYGNSDVSPILEDAKCSPVSPYGFNKLISETLCLSYYKQYKVSVSIVRAFSIYGPGLRKQLLWDACRKINQSRFDFFGSGQEVRDWLHVSDLARLVFKISQHQSMFSVYNAGSGNGVCISTILGQVFAQFDVKQAPLFSNLAKAGDPQGMIADISNAAALGWSPLIPLEEGVKSYVAWYKEQL